MLDAAQSAETLGFGAVWLTNGGPEDPLPLLAALPIKTDRIRLGTSVLQTYLRHPFVVATEANVIDQLSPRRLRLGVGPSHVPLMESLGIPRDAPLNHLREYVSVLRSLVGAGSVDFKGRHYSVSARLNRSVSLPIMVGALQPATFRLAGSDRRRCDQLALPSRLPCERRDPKHGPRSSRVRSESTASDRPPCCLRARCT